MSTSLAVGRELTVTLPRLHPGQLRIRAAIAKEHGRFGVIMCGRRWGKTTDGVEWLAEGAISGEPCAWLAPTYKYLAEAWREMLVRLRPVLTRISEQDKRLELLGGGSIECWSLDTADPARGRKYGRLVVDEAGLVRDLLNRWNAAIRPTLVDLKGHARIYGTPKGRQQGFVALFARGECHEEGWCSFRAATIDNPYIPPEEVELARRELPPSVFATEFEGIPADDGGNPFSIDAIAACIGPMSTELPAVWGWDFARAQDWTVGVGIDPYGTVCRFERWQLKPWGETTRLIADHVKKVPAVGDSTGIGDVVIDSLQNVHCPMMGYVFTPKSKQALMQRLAVAIQTRVITFPDGVLRSELETFTYEYTVHGVRYSAPEGLHDDAVMALALAVYAYDRVAPRVAAEPVPQHEERRDTTRWQDFVGVPEGYREQDVNYSGLGAGW